VTEEEQQMAPPLQRPGYWRRLWSAVKRAVLGKSSQEYMEQYSPGPGYWDSAATAQRNGRPAMTESETEPVHGWSARQLHDYLARNPDYEAIYREKLRGRTVSPGPQANIKVGNRVADATGAATPKAQNGEQDRAEDRWQDDGGKG
jgi:hypothetical protein